MFKSPNPNKMHIAKQLTKTDFKLTTSLEVEGTFYPKDKEKMVNVYGIKSK